MCRVVLHMFTKCRQSLGVASKFDKISFCFCTSTGILQDKMKVNQDHWNTILDFMETNPEMMTNKFHGPTGRARATNLWQRVTQLLNNLGYGSKSTEEWRKAVTDWKCKVKAKAAKLKNEQQATGGGVPKHIPLTKAEQRLLQLMGLKSIDGDDVPELGTCQINTTATSSLEEVVLPVASSSRNEATILELGGRQLHSETECTNPSGSGNIEAGELDMSDQQYSILATPSSSKRRRTGMLTNKSQVADSLLEMNKESVTLLRSIDSRLEALNNNISKLTDGIISIADSMKELVKK